VGGAGDVVNGPRRRFLVAAWFLVEAMLLWWLGRAAGWGWVVAVVLGGFVAAGAVVGTAARTFRDGLVGMRRARRVTTVDPATGQTTTVLTPGSAPEPGNPPVDERSLRESGLLLSAAGLLAVPGLLSDAAGLILLVPPVRRMILDRRPAAAGPRITVIRGETVPPNATRHQDDGERPGDGGAGPTIISGEILPPQREPPPE
jgi:UPF0716 protein FxsA